MIRLARPDDVSLAPPSFRSRLQAWLATPFEPDAPEPPRALGVAVALGLGILGGVLLVRRLSSPPRHPSWPGT